MSQSSYPCASSDMLKPVLHWRDGPIAYIRFNRPNALNAIDVQIAEMFFGACSDISSDDQVRAVLISSEGRAFMAGGDVAAMMEDPVAVSKKLIHGMHSGLKILASLKAPVVAGVHGAVAGGGFGLMLACDLVIAAEGTKFTMAYPLIGASCDCSTSWGLPRVVGWRKAMELALLSDPIDAHEAQRLSLVNRVVPADRLEVECLDLVRRLANGPTTAFSHLKRLIRTSFDNDLKGQLNAEADGFFSCAATKDFQEGLTSFIEKRSPLFIGR